MNRRERFLAVLRGEVVDRLPVAPIYMHLYLAEEIRRRALERFRALLEVRQEIPLDPEIEIEIQTEAYLGARQHLGSAPDWIWTRLLPTTNWLRECSLRREGERVWRIHLPSGNREELSLLTAATDSTEDNWQGQAPRSEEEVDALVPVPSPDELLANGSLGLARRLVQMIGDETFVCGTVGQPFWKCYSLLGFHGLMTMPLDRPRLFHYLLERQLRASQSMARTLAAVGVHGVFVEECLTSADLISARMYDEFVFPYDQTLLRELDGLGLPAVLYVCGDVVPRLARLAELAPAALAVEESKKGFRVDLAEVARAVGRRSVVFGNVDATQIKDWDEAQMDQQLQEQVRAAKEAKGFVVSMGSPFPLDTPPGKVKAFITAGRSRHLADLWAHG